MPGRRAAVEESLALISTYFSAGHGWGKAPAGLQRGTEDEQDEQLRSILAGIRLRAATICAEQFVSAVAPLRNHASFRYRQERSESTDLSQGQLDVSRYATRGAGTTDQRTYPIVRTRRSAATAENMLVAAVGIQIRREIAGLLSERLGADSNQPAIPRNASDRRRAEALLREVDRVSRIPAIREAASALAGQRLRGHRLMRDLVDRTSRRLRRREVTYAPPYSACADLAADLLQGQPGSSAGDSMWNFYDSTFDARLFEIWFLGQLIDEIDNRLSSDQANPADLRRRLEGPIRTWRLPYVELAVYFQRSPHVIDPALIPRWKADRGTTSDLVGIPDVTLTATFTATGHKIWFILDPKLRQRTDRPTEELFKILGYFDAYRLSGGSYGGVIYYEPGAQASTITAWTARGAQPGRLLAASTDPAGADSVTQAIGAFVDLVFDGAQVPMRSGVAGDDAQVPTPTAPDGQEASAQPAQRAGSGVEPLPPEGRSDHEEIVGAVQRATQAYLLRTGRELGPAAKPSRRSARATLGDARWRTLDKKSRNMLATSIHVAASLNRSQDHSAPVLGCCAVVERLLRSRLVEPSAGLAADDSEAAKYRRSTLTLGSVLNAIEQTEISPTGLAGRVTLRGAAQQQIDMTALLGLLPVLRSMNTDLRVPAAHVEVLDVEAWHRTYQLLMVGDHGQPALFWTVIDLLHPALADQPGQAQTGAP